MAQISLYFSSPNSPELSRVVFSHHALGGALESVRGKTGGAYGTARTFQWTAAVRALCVLLVETAARISTSHDAHAQSSSAVLEGSANTPASSLDYALGKNTAWLIDMFGETPHGKPLAQRLFQRSNPDRKRPGPAAVSLNLRAWDGAHISVFLDGRLVRAAHELAALSATIAQSAPQTAPPCAGQTQVMPFSASGLRETLRTMLGTEIQHALSRTDIFVRSALLNTVNKIHCGGSFRSVAGRGAVLDLALDSSLCLTSDRLGLGIQEDILRRQLCRPEPLRVAVAAPTTGATALFFYLAFVKNYHLELHLKHAHAVEVARRIISHNYEPLPDVCCVGVAPAASMLAAGTRSGFKPLMLLPGVSHGIVGVSNFQRSPSPLSAANYAFIDDDPSVPSFLFDELTITHHIPAHKTARLHLEPDETFAALRAGQADFRAILFFPHYQINRLFNGCTCVHVPPLSCNVEQMILFAHASFLADSDRARCLDIALRDAWLELRTNTRMREHILDLMIAHPDYMSTLLRSSGLYNFPQ